MGDLSSGRLGRREREILEALYRLERGTVAQVVQELDSLPDAPSYSSVRKMLEVLEEKGVVRHAVDGPRYVYTPVVPRQHAARDALRRVLRTFFNDATEDAVLALLQVSHEKLTPQQLDRIAEMARRTRKSR